MFLWLQFFMWKIHSLSFEMAVSFQGNSVVSEMLWGTLCVICLEVHVKSIQGVIGTSERVTSQTRKL